MSYISDYLRKRRKRQRKAGICIDCGKEPAGPGTLGENCKRKRREHARLYHTYGVQGWAR